MSVSIPKPCSENWDQMTPTQKGAFCQKCAVDVVDFSNKSAQEIKETLKANIGQKMCGRFEKTQLFDLNQSYINWENQSRKTLQSKFLWACLIVFGMTIFTGCENISAQETVDKITLMLPTTTSDSLKTIEDSTKTESINETHFIKGDIAYTPPIQEEEILIGEVVCTLPEDTTKSSSVDTTNQVPKEIHKELIMGRFMIPEHPEEPIQDIENIEKEALEHPDKIPTKIDSPAIKAELYPNPTGAQSQLNVHPSENDYYTITVFSIDGKALFSLYKGQMENRNYSIPVDLGKYPDGLYFIRIENATISKSLKLNKVG